MFQIMLCLLFLFSYKTTQLSLNFQIASPPNVIDMVLSPDEKLLFIYNSSAVHIYNALNGQSIKTIKPKMNLNILKLTVNFDTHWFAIIQS
jgi:hypothetical protein